MPTRRLALVTAPRAGETFASWVDRMALVNRCPSAEIAQLMGLSPRGTPRISGLLLTECGPMKRSGRPCTRQRVFLAAWWTGCISPSSMAGH